MLYPITYSMSCAEESMGIEIEPLGQEYNDNKDNSEEAFALKSTITEGNSESRQD